MTAPPQVLLIANPISGRGRSPRIARDIRTTLETNGYRVRWLETRSEQDVRAAVRGGGDAPVVLSVGGDGTLHALLNSIDSDGTVLCPIPGGTGNAFAKEIGLHGDGDILRRLERGRVERWDVGVRRSDGRRFLLFAGAGFTGEILNRFARVRRRSIFMANYFQWGLLTLVDFPRSPITVEVDGSVVSRRATWVEVLNISQYGGPMQFAPRASPRDGWFDVLIFESDSKHRVLEMLARGVAQRWLGYPFRIRCARLVRGRRVRLDSPGRIATHMDGDFSGFLPVEWELRPAAVRILVPGTSPGIRISQGGAG